MAELRDLIVYGNSRLIGDTDASKITAVSVSGSSITASVGFSGNLTGTASYASNALSASRATSASRADSAASATSATSATKLVGSSGSTSVPVYFDAGVPKVVTAINLANITASTGFKGNLTGTASYAISTSVAHTANEVNIVDYGDNEVCYVPIVSSRSGSQEIFTDSELRWDTSENVLLVTASFATSASIAISASQAVTASYVSGAVEKPKQVELGGKDEICFYANPGHTYLLTVSSPEEAGYPTDQMLIRVDENDYSRVSKAVRLFGGRDYPSVLRKDVEGRIVYITRLSAGYTYVSLIDYYTGENVTFTSESEADLEDIFPIESLGEQAILTKEFPAYTCSAASDDKATLAFFEVRPTDSNWMKPWHVRYRLYVTTSTNGCQGYYDCYISQQGDNLTYRVWNERYSPSYYPIYAHRVWWHNTQALWNNRVTNPVKVGARVYSAYAANTLARTFKIEILEQYGCSVDFLNSIKTRDSFYTNAKYAETSLDATTLGVTVTGDRNSNTLPTQLYDSYAGLLVHSGSVLYRYKICGFDASGSLVPTTVTNQTSNTVVAKSASAVPMKVHKGLIFYSSTTAVSGTLRTAANTIYKYQGASNTMPLYNFSANPGVNTDIYLKGSYNPYTDEFTLDTSSTTSYYQFIPQGSGSLNSASAFVSGAYYWYVGYKTSNATYANFALEHPLYQYRYDENIGRNALTLVEPITNVPDMSAPSGSRGFIKNKVGGYRIPISIDSYSLEISGTSLGIWDAGENEKDVSLEEFRGYSSFTEGDIEAILHDARRHTLELGTDEGTIYMLYRPEDYGENVLHFYRSDSENSWDLPRADFSLDYRLVEWNDDDQSYYYIVQLPSNYVAPIFVDGVATMGSGGSVVRTFRCTTSATAVTKSVTAYGDRPINPYMCRVTVDFVNKNTADSPYLNVQGASIAGSSVSVKGDIYYNNVKITTGSWKGYLYGQVDLLYSGSRWNIVGVPPAALEDTVGNLETLLAAI